MGDRRRGHTRGIVAMMAARWPRQEPLDDRLLVVDVREGTWSDRRIRDLPASLSPGDLLVVNDAATIPASLFATTPAGRRVEIRLASHLGDAQWRVVLFGEGDWRTQTEDRTQPPNVQCGDLLRISSELSASIVAIDRDMPRLVVVRFSEKGAGLWSGLYRHGRPVQYAHVDGPLAVWHVQTPFASRPWAVEMPSAGRALTWALISEIKRSGVRVAALTHASGLSSTGDRGIDSALPLPERFDLPTETIRELAETRAAGGRVVAAGTTVVRALEGCAAMHGGELVAGEGVTNLRIGESFRRRIVGGVLTGLHELGSSHRALLHAFAPEAILARAFAHAEAEGYLGHEFGDTCLLLASGPIP